jgi:putative transposase
MRKQKKQSDKEALVKNPQFDLDKDISIPDEKINLLKLDELNDDHIEVYAENWRLISLIEGGASIKEAKEKLGIKRSERSIRDLRKRFKRHGQKGLIDKRWLRTTDCFVLTPEVKSIILGAYYTYSAAGLRLVWKITCEECLDRRLPEPSESSVKKYIASLPEAFKMFRGGKPGIRKWEQTAAPVVRYENTTYSNERWQGDHSPLPIWIRIKVDGKWEPARVHISVLLDAHSRAIMGYVISVKHPDSWTISLVFHKAISRKSNEKWRGCGIPSVFQSDRGRDFQSQATVAALGKLHIIFAPDPPYYPNSKGKVERFFKTLDLGHLRRLPGHMDSVGKTEGAALKRVHEFLTFQQLDEEIEGWILNEYHQTKHSETGRKPAELWEETVRLRMPESEDDLSLFLLKDDKGRTVKNVGILLTYDGRKHVYWCPELVFYSKQKVRLAYNPEDMESVLVYCADTGKRLCEAFDMRSENSRYTINDVKAARSQFRRGLAERIKDYREEIKKEDRRDARKSEWDEARKKVIEVDISKHEDTAESDKDKEVKLLLEKFRKRDQGE